MKKHSGPQGNGGARSIKFNIYGTESLSLSRSGVGLICGWEKRKK